MDIFGQYICKSELLEAVKGESLVVQGRRQPKRILSHIPATLEQNDKVGNGYESSETRVIYMRFSARSLSPLKKSSTQNYFPRKKRKRKRLDGMEQYYRLACLTHDIYRHFVVNSALSDSEQVSDCESECYDGDLSDADMEQDSLPLTTHCKGEGDEPTPRYMNFLIRKMEQSRSHVSNDKKGDNSNQKSGGQNKSASTSIKQNETSNNTDSKGVIVGVGGGQPPEDGTTTDSASTYVDTSSPHELDPTTTESENLSPSAQDHASIKRKSKKSYSKRVASSMAMFKSLDKKMSQLELPTKRYGKMSSDKPSRTTLVGDDEEHEESDDTSNSMSLTSLNHGTTTFEKNTPVDMIDSFHTMHKRKTMPKHSHVNFVEHRHTHAFEKFRAIEDDDFHEHSAKTAENFKHLKAPQRGERHHRHHTNLKKHAEEHHKIVSPLSLEDAIGYDHMRYRLSLTKLREKEVEKKIVFDQAPELIDTVEKVYESHKERDSEWLQLVGEEMAPDIDENLPEELISPPIHVELSKFLEAQKPLLRTMTWFGVYPFTHVTLPNKCVKVVWKSWSLRHIVLTLITSLWFAFAVSSLASIVSIFSHGSIRTPYQTVLDVEIHKYIVEGVWMFLIFVFLSIWGFSTILDFGYHYAEFMTRFNYSVCYLNYDVTLKIKRIIVTRLCSYAAFEVIFLLLYFYGGDWVPLVRESCGFVSILIFNPLFTKMRLQKEYGMAEFVGSLIVTGADACMTLVMLHFVVYARAIQNMSKKFNLRLGYRLRRLMLLKKSGEHVAMFWNIPYKKIFTEHLILSSLIKHFSLVYSLVLNLYLVVMGCQFILFLYGNTRYFNSTLLAENASYEASPIRDLAQPLRTSLNAYELVFSNIVYLAHFFWATYLFLNSLNQSGYSFGMGIDYIRRHGLTSCKNSKERRFVLSMFVSGNPKSQTFFGNKSLAINREFMVFFLGAMFTFWAVAMTFPAGRLDIKVFTYCDEMGVCRSVTYAGGSSVKAPSSIFTSQKKKPTTTQPPYVPPPPPPPPPPGVPFEMEQSSSWLYRDNLPCVGVSKGLMPKHDYAIYFLACKTFWKDTLRHKVIKIPHLFLYRPSSTSSKAVYVPFHRGLSSCVSGVPNPFPESYTPALFKNATLNYQKFVDCADNIIDEKLLDDCGNPPATVLDRFNGSFSIPDEVHLILTEELPGGSVSNNLFLCCYSYVNSHAKAVRGCNMPDYATLKQSCSQTEDSEGKNFIEKLRTWRQSEKSKTETDPLANNTIRDNWKKCICRHRWNRIQPNGGDKQCQSMLSRSSSTIDHCEKLLSVYDKPIDANLFHNCTSMWLANITDPLVKHNNHTYVPHIYKSYIGDGKFENQTLYKAFYRRVNLESYENCANATYQSYSKEWISENIYYKIPMMTCQNGKMKSLIKIEDFDDCFHPPADGFNPYTQKWEAATLELIETPDPLMHKTYVEVPGRGYQFVELHYMCCYSYKIGPAGSINCNIPVKDSVKWNCYRRNTDEVVFDLKLWEYHEQVRAMGNMTYDMRYNDGIRNDWKKCICRARVNPKNPGEGDSRCNELYDLFVKDKP